MRRNMNTTLTMVIFLWAMIHFISPIPLSAQTESEDPKTAVEKNVLRFVIVDPEIGNPKTVLHSFKPLMEWQSQKIRKEIKVVILPNVEQTVKALQDDKVQMGYTGVVDFFKIQEKFPIKPLVTIVRKDSPSYSSCMIVRKENKDITIDDLKGKRFGFTSFHKALGGLYPQIILHEKGYGHDLSKFFSTVTPYYTDITAIYDLLKGTIDVCAITVNTLDTLKITSPGLSNKIHIIHTEENLMYAPFFYSEKMDPQLRDKIIEEVLAFSKTIEGRQLLMMFKVDGLKKVSDEDYKEDRKRARKLGYINGDDTE